MAPLFAQRFRAGWREETELYPLVFWPRIICSECWGELQYIHHLAGRLGWQQECRGCSLITDIGSLPCSYCQQPAVLKDHLIPFSMGGALVVPCCFECNDAKLDLMPGTVWKVGSEALFHACSEARRIRSMLAATLSLAKLEKAPAKVQETIGTDIAWWEGYLRTVEGR